MKTTLTQTIKPLVKMVQCFLILSLITVSHLTAQTVQTFLFNGTFIAPAGVNSIQVEAWGGGGGGGGSNANVSAGGGGGAGAYSKTTGITVIPGNSYTVIVGSAGNAGAAAGGIGGNGGNSSFNTTDVVAQGGTGGGPGIIGSLSGAAGIAGTAGASTGATKFSGGNGAAGIAGTSSGGGGSSGGTAANGNPAVGSTGGAAVSGGGAGGNGGASNSAGIAGTVPGGGGGGGRRTSATNRGGGAGAKGQVVITYTLPACAGTPAPGNTVSGTNPACSGANFTLSFTNPFTFVTGITYQWQSSPDNITWVNGAGVSTNATYITSQVVSTYYQCVATCTASGLSASSTPLFVPLNSFSVPESFSGGVVPPGCWTTTTTVYQVYNSVSAFGSGTGSLEYFFYAQSAGGIDDFTSPVFAPTTPGTQLSFDEAYATYSGELDGLVIKTSTDGGASYTTLVTYTGGAAGTLNTGGTVGNAEFVPAAGQWQTQTITLPTGTNRIIFEGVSDFGNDLYVDNINMVNTACFGTPAPGNTISSANPVCSGTTFSLSLQNTFTLTGITYQWQSSPDNISWTNIAGATSATLSTSQTTATFYQCFVTCSNSGMSVVSAPVNETMNALPIVGSTVLPSASVCPGTSVTLSGTGASTYTWSGGIIDGIAFLAVATATYTVTGTSLAGCINTATVTITINTAPTISCTGNQSANDDAGNCSAVVNYSAPIVTGSPAPVITYTFSGATTGSGSGTGTGSAFNSGITTVSLTATNTCGAPTCSFLVTVADNINPTITAPASVNTTTNTGCTATGVALGTPTTADNCSVASTTNNAPAAFPLGNTTVTWTVTDGSGNIAIANQTVTVTDNINPTIISPADVSICIGSPVVLGTPTTADNCSVASVTNNAPGVFPVGTTIVTWTVIDGSGNTATANQNVTVNALAVGSASNIVICNGQVSNLPLNSTITGTTFTWTSVVTLGAVIGEQDCAGGCGTTIEDILTNIGFVHGVVEYTITPTSPAGCIGTPFIADVTVGSVPATPVSITGPSVICGLTTAVYSIAAIPEATNYIWTITTGGTNMTIVSGQGTPLIHVAISSNNLNLFVINVIAANNCGNSGTTTLSVTKKPSAPGIITGPTSVCSLTTATYSISDVFGATGYTWTLPTGMTIASGTGTTQITVNIAPAFIYGNVIVAALDACGNVPGTSLAITGNVPIAPVTIAGPGNVCTITSATYSVAAVAGATGYQWAATGTGMSISGSSTGLSVLVLMDGTDGGSLSCKATNICGQGPPRTLALLNTAIEPGAITGPSNVCGMTTATYSVPVITTGNVVAYNWVVPSGLTITSGQGTTSIIVSCPSGGTVTPNGILKVSSINACGSISAIRSMAVTRCLDAVPMNTPAETQLNMFSNIYPNPATSEFTIDVKIDSNKQPATNSQQLIVEVYDILGNLLIQQNHQVITGDNTIKTNIEQYKDGIYFVRLIDSNSNILYSQRMIKN